MYLVHARIARQNVDEFGEYPQDHPYCKTREN